MILRQEGITLRSRFLRMLSLAGAGGGRSAPLREIPWGSFNGYTLTWRQNAD